MAANDYTFLEHWYFPRYTPEQVYEVLSNATLLPQWWKGVYLEATPLARYSAPVVGAKVRARARGFLPYHLDFTLEALRLEQGRCVEVRARGDFEGIWRATLTEDGDGTRVELDWRVRVHKPLIRYLSVLLEPLFAWNHRWTTPRGEQGMLAYLDAKHGRAAVPSQSMLALKVSYA